MKKITFSGESIPVKKIKKILLNLLRKRGYELRRIRPEVAGGDHRPVGNMLFLLEDLKKRGLTCRTILDVGANVGSWSKMAAEVFDDAVFVLVEPQAEMRDHLQDFCRDHPGSVYFLVGAGSAKGTLTLTVSDDLAGSSLLPLPDDALKTAGKQREIEIVTIDSLIEQHNIHIPELVKLDVQGFELEALKGASLTFGRTEVYILEVSLFSFSDIPNMPVLHEVIRFMLERGYRVYDFPGFSRRPFDGALGQCDICFVKNDGFLRASDSWD